MEQIYHESLDVLAYFNLLQELWLICPPEPKGTVRPNGCQKDVYDINLDYQTMKKSRKKKKGTDLS